MEHLDDLPSSLQDSGDMMQEMYMKEYEKTTQESQAVRARLKEVSLVVQREIADSQASAQRKIHESKDRQKNTLNGTNKEIHINKRRKKDFGRCTKGTDNARAKATSTKNGRTCQRWKQYVGRSEAPGDTDK